MVKKYKTIYADPPWMERGGELKRHGYICRVQKNNKIK